MKKGKDIAITYPEIFIVHHNKPGKALEFHIHKEHHLFIPLQGEIEVETKNQKCIIGPGKMIYLPPKVAHKFSSSDKKGERLICNIDPKIWPSKKNEFNDDLYELPLIQAVKELLFFMLVNEKTPIYQQLTLSIAEIVKDAINNQSQVKGSYEHFLGRVEDERLKACLKLMQKDMTLKLDSYATNSGMSARTMNRLFKIELGILPKEYLQRIRIEHAKMLLTSRKMNITEVALSVGYESVSSFTTNFSKIVGMLPSDYR